MSLASRSTGREKICHILLIPDSRDRLLCRIMNAALDGRVSDHLCVRKLARSLKRLKDAPNLSAAEMPLTVKAKNYAGANLNTKHRILTI